MKNAKLEVLNNKNEVVGYLNKFRGPAFTGYATAYAPLDINGKPIMVSQNSFEAAKQAVLSHVS